MLKLTPKQLARQAQFKKPKPEPSTLELEWRDWRGDHQFEFRPTATQWDPDEPKDLECGPTAKTIQFHRTIRR